MTRASSVAQHPAVLAAAALLGALMGAVLPAVTPLMALISVAFVTVLQMVALPLMAVAVVFGLRRLLELPQPWHRAGLLLGAGWGLVMVAALMGLGAAHLFATVLPTTEADRDRLSILIHTADQTTAIALSTAPTGSGGTVWQDLIPSNVFEALSKGRIPAVMLAAILFGLALHLQSRNDLHDTISRSAYALLESAYRALESLIERLAVVVPVAAWAMAGHATAQLSLAHLMGLAGLVVPLVICVALWGAATVTVVGMTAGVSYGQALVALGRPMCISLLASAPGASIAGYIDAMSNRLGYSRGVVELLTPVAPFFVKAGEALYFALLFVFLCTLYGRHLSPSDAGVIAAAACWAALVSVQLPMGRTLAAGSVGLGWLDLPIDAVAPMLVGLELLSFGMRQLVSDLCACMLIAWASRGVTHAPVATGGLMTSGPQGGQVVLREPMLLGMLLLALCALLLAFLLGVGLGLRAA